MSQMEDLAPLLSRAARGEQEAYREIYRRFRPLLVRLASGFAALDADEVEDVVQESFVRAFRALPKLRASGAFEPWLLSIARNRAMTTMAHKSTGSRLRAQLSQETELETPALPTALRLERETGLVREMIAELPEGAGKRTVELFYIEGRLTAREIAEQLGVGKSAVTMRLERFRAKVKRELLRRLLAAQWE
jgi:RNA polymerase sigma-70 factor (ECF subfamily)